MGVKSCMNCKHGDIPEFNEPCVSCDHCSNWEDHAPQWTDGREAGREWISVEDMLPEAKLAVLAYGRRHIRKTETTELPAPHVAYTRGEDEGWFTWDYGDYVYVSHWMPLPEPPMEETSHV